LNSTIIQNKCKNYSVVEEPIEVTTLN
jgi:hypothetical protein